MRTLMPPMVKSASTLQLIHDRREDQMVRAAPVAGVVHTVASR